MELDYFCEKLMVFYDLWINEQILVLKTSYASVILDLLKLIIDRLIEDNLVSIKDLLEEKK